MNSISTRTFLHELLRLKGGFPFVFFWNVFFLHYVPLCLHFIFKIIETIIVTNITCRMNKK
jgi:hypothetical protein